jgi:hypothetical protein
MYFNKKCFDAILLYLADNIEILDPESRPRPVIMQDVIDNLWENHDVHILRYYFGKIVEAKFVTTCIYKDKPAFEDITYEGLIYLHSISSNSEE